MHTPNPSAREQVFGNVRHSLASLGPTIRQNAQTEYDKAMSTETPSPVVDGLLVENFLAKHGAVHGTSKTVRSYAEVPAAVSEFLDAHSLPSEMIMGASPFLKNLDWPDSWRVETRNARKTDLVSVTDAVCAIAETGTIVHVSSPTASSTHAFVPENHVVIINSGEIVRHLDDALRLISARMDGGTSGVHMITGPSKTADVEQTIQYGAHGPRRLHVIMIDAK